MLMAHRLLMLWTDRTDRMVLTVRVLRKVTFGLDEQHPSFSEGKVVFIAYM